MIMQRYAAATVKTAPADDRNVSPRACSRRIGHSPQTATGARRSPRGPTRRRFSRPFAGFTLVELLVALAIAAILAAIAVPSYQAQVAKARRVNMQGDLIRLAQFMERLYSEHGCYSSGDDCSDPSQPAIATSIDNYSVSFDEFSADSFTIQASPVEGSPQDGDGVLTIDNLGGRSWD
jgi:type IV pilus assembly protein PilE